MIRHHLCYQCALLPMRRGPRVRAEHPSSLRPLFFLRDIFYHSSGALRRENAEVCPLPLPALSRGEGGVRGSIRELNSRRVPSPKLAAANFDLSPQAVASGARRLETLRARLFEN